MDVVQDKQGAVALPHAFGALQRHDAVQARTHEFPDLLRMTGNPRQGQPGEADDQGKSDDGRRKQSLQEQAHVVEAPARGRHEC